MATTELYSIEKKYQIVGKNEQDGKLYYQLKETPTDNHINIEANKQVIVIVRELEGERGLAPKVLAVKRISEVSSSDIITELC